MQWVEYAVFLAILVVLAQPVGTYLARVFERQPTFVDRLLCPVEAALYWLLGVDPKREMTPLVYFASFLGFGVLGAFLLYLMLVFQLFLPGGPGSGHLTTPISADLAANIAVSFSTTSTWQSYAGESTLRYLVQAIGLTSQNFLGGAAGLAVGIAAIRGFARTTSQTLGNFWVDLIRGLLWVLLPVSLVGSVILVWQGVPLNLSPYTVARTLEGQTQTIAQGPVAVLEFIKNLGTNGGGFFNANGAHPYANPTPLSNFLGLLAIAVVPAALPLTFGRMVGRPRAGVVLLVVMILLFVIGLAVGDAFEAPDPPRLAGLGVAGGNMEGRRCALAWAARCWRRSLPRTVRPVPTTRCTTPTSR